MLHTQDELSSLGLIVPNWPAPEMVLAGSTTRHALTGVSTAPFHALNLGMHVGDMSQAVQQNRAQLPFPNIAWLNQTHSTTITQIKHLCETQKIVSADASFTAEPGMTCAVMTADCLPILLCDIHGDWVASVHAGWRGLAAGILEKTLLKLEAYAKDSLRRPFSMKEVLAWIGPCISANAFEVGEDVKQILFEYPQAFSDIEGGGAKFRCDLVFIANAKLEKAGVTQIFGGDFCTFGDENRFFSHRRDAKQAGSTGRMASLICILPQ